MVGVEVVSKQNDPEEPVRKIDIYRPFSGHWRRPQCVIHSQKHLKIYVCNPHAACDVAPALHSHARNGLSKQRRALGRPRVLGFHQPVLWSPMVPNGRRQLVAGRGSVRSWNENGIMGGGYRKGTSGA